jgi:muramidase (phage lysozyme)
MAEFDPRVEIMLGTKSRTEIAKRKPYEAVFGVPVAESSHPNPNN